MTTIVSAHCLKTMGKCPYGRREEGVLGSGHRQQPAIRFLMPGVETEIRWCLIKEKQSLRYGYAVMVKWFKTVSVRYHSKCCVASKFLSTEVLAL